ncbi:MAG: UDP-N-acetylmuramoyl-L-alanine--D-glutamate ligase [Elusimicrobia bacterium]|nr:UDP-N-acetylmuramoyl-L-alanine--D-glutamate ligase [Elusimicrobiota bacterium]
MKFDKASFAPRSKACVLGFGRSGAACANLLAEAGFEVLLSELKPLAPDAGSKAGLLPSVRLESGGHGPEVLKCSFVVKSPGIFPASEIIKKIRKAGIPIFSELEVSLSFCPPCRVLAVTGTNGKTTTATLLHLVMEKAAVGGGNAWLAGNVGKPLALLVKDIRAGDSIVLEVSSYQLEDSSFFAPDVSCLLNVTPDHIDHHGGMDNYLAAKRKVFSGQAKNAWCVFNAQDEECRKMALACPSKALWFSSAEGTDGVNARVAGGKLRFSFGKVSCDILPPKLPGAHNLENAMCAGLMALAAGAAPVAVADAFAAFKGVEHRIEEAGVVKGVRCINDSKATNVDSTLIALRALRGEGRKIWLILGGQDKGLPYAPLAPLVKECVKAVLLIGEASDKIESGLAGAAAMERCGTMENALSFCLKNAEAGDILLLSPACASFDQFRDFEHRGWHFKALVKAAGS